MRFRKYPSETLMKTLFLLAVTGLALLSGQAIARDYAAKGNPIIVAKYDSRFSGGAPVQAVTDNAGGIPSAVAGAAGTPMSGAGGAALNVAVGAIINLIAGNAMKDVVPIMFKIIYDKDCEYEQFNVDFKRNPEAAELNPGYVGRFIINAAGGVKVATALDADGQQIYLTKDRPCYNQWVHEWKLHQTVAETKWTAHKFWLFGGKPIEEIPEPDLPWVK